MIQSTEGHQHPRIGVGALIIKDNKFLFGKRVGKHSPGRWSAPGGHLEFGESVIVCAARETQEEAGIAITNAHLAPVFTEDFYPQEGQHYLTVWVISDYKSGQVTVREPEQIIDWGWYEWDNLPKPLATFTENLLQHDFKPLDFHQEYLLNKREPVSNHP